MTAPITRPVLRYHGGKFKIAKWVLSFFPPHDIYVEPFGGGGSVLMLKPPAPRLDIYNDVDGQMVNLFRVLRDPEQAARLRELCELTPFAREEFEATYAPPSDDPVENARRLLFRSAAGFGATALVRNKTGFRSKDDPAGNHAAAGWRSWPAQVPAIVERLRGVVIEDWPAAKIIAAHDHPNVLFYCDPPYLEATRNLRFSRIRRNQGKGDYEHEMTDDDHRALAEQLHGVRGMVVLSGYPSALYDRELYADWERHERPHVANGGQRRTEVLWLNPAASRARHDRQHSIFTD